MNFQQNGHSGNPVCKMPVVPCNDQLPLGFSVTPMQRFKNLYSPEDALPAGTIFHDLNMPYEYTNLRRN